MLFVRNENYLEMPPGFWHWFDGKQRELFLSDRQIANKAKISNSVISKARNGVSPIGFEALAKIAKAFDTRVSTVYKLAGLLEEDEILSPEKAEFMKLLDTLSDQDQEELLAMMRVRAERNRRKAR